MRLTLANAFGKHSVDYGGRFLRKTPDILTSVRLFVSTWSPQNLNAIYKLTLRSIGHIVF